MSKAVKYGITSSARSIARGCGSVFASAVSIEIVDFVSVDFVSVDIVVGLLVLLVLVGARSYYHMVRPHSSTF